MKKKKLAFLLGITPNLSFAAGNVALGINKYMSHDDYDIVVYYTELPAHDIAAFSKIPHVKLRQFNLSDEFVDTMLNKMPDTSRFKSKTHLMCFCHFEVFPLLDEYENVAWIDADTGIQGDLAGICEFAPFGITPDTPWTVGDQFSVPIGEYRMDIPGHCTAVMVVGDALPYKQIYKFLYERAVQYADRLKNPDQAIMSIMLQEFGITPNLMDAGVWQCISWRDEALAARVVHFGTERKVWNNTNICNAFPEWYRTHLQWLALGGSDFDRRLITPRNARGALDWLDKLTSCSKKTWYLFGVVPVYRIKSCGKKSWHCLFSVVPFLRAKES